MKGSYDFFTLVTCLIILGLQIHNPFQKKEKSTCTCDASAATVSRPPDAGAQQSRPSAAARGASVDDGSPVYRRAREVQPARPSSGMSTDALLRELDSIQAKAKEQQDVLAAAGRMPPPSPILQHLKEVDAQTPQRNPPVRPAREAIPQAAPRAQHPASSTRMAAVPDMGLALRRRDEFGLLLQAQQPRGLGVILGVGRGEFALRLLADWSSSQGLYLVDPFIHIWRGYDDPANLQDAEHQMVFEELRNRLQPFEGRYVLVRDFSYSFAEVFKRETAGMATFIYVDANHAEEAVSRDLELWWPMLASGGIIAGSTFTDDASGRVHVRSAVERFASRRQLQVMLTQDDRPPSWFILKP